MKHGEHPKSGPSREYTIWVMMKQRCLNPNAVGYARYGGRGIRICPEWMNDVTNFIRDMGRAPSVDHTLDRIDCDGHYEPSNCRWATALEQNRNARTNRLIEFRGETRCVSEWCDHFGLKYAAVYARLAKGWSAEDAFTTPNYQGRRDIIKSIRARQD